MYLVIYKKKNKLYFNTAKKLNEKFSVINEKCEKTDLSYRYKIASYVLNDWDDFRRIRNELMEKWALRILIVENEYKDKIQWKLVLLLLNNVYWSGAITEKQKEVINEQDPDDKVDTRSYEIKEKSDLQVASEKLGFEYPQDFPNLF